MHYLLRVIVASACLLAPAWLSAEVPQVQQHLDLMYAEYGERQMHVDLFLPPDNEEAALNRPAVLVIHGGGWLKGDRTKFHDIARALAQRGFVAAAVEYRLGGEAKFPAAIHDCNTATRWLRTNAEKYGVDPQKITAVGGSAGGHLVGLMASAPHVNELQGAGYASVSSQLQAAVVLAGPMQLASGPVAEKSRANPTESNSNRWLGKTVDEDLALYQLASPYTHLSKKTSPLLFMTGEFDQPERNLATRDKLRELGVATDIRVYADGKHGCWNREPWQTVMVNDMAAFLYEQLGMEEPQHVLLEQKTDWGSMRFDPTGITLSLDDVAKTKSVSIPRLNNQVPSATLYQGNYSHTWIPPFKVGIDQWSQTLPEDLRTGQATIRVDTVGRPYLPVIPRVVTQSQAGEVTLPAHESITHGEKLRYEPQPKKNTIGYWANPKDWCQWMLYVEHPGTFRVEILQGCGKGHGGSEVAVLAAEQKLTFTVEDTGHFQNFKQREIGTLKIDQPGVYSLEVRPINKSAGAVMDVRQMRLVPVK